MKRTIVLLFVGILLWLGGTASALTMVTSVQGTATTFSLGDGEFLTHGSIASYPSSGPITSYDMVATVYEHGPAIYPGNGNGTDPYPGNGNGTDPHPGNGNGTDPHPGNGNGTDPAPVPEPTTILLFGAGLAGLAAVGRRRKVV